MLCAEKHIYIQYTNIYEYIHATCKYRKCKYKLLTVRSLVSTVPVALILLCISMYIMNVAISIGILNSFFSVSVERIININAYYIYIARRE